MAVLEIRHRSIDVSLHRVDVVAHDDHESWVRLSTHAVTFGRGLLTTPHILVDDITASRRHGAFEPHRDGFALHDLGSTGGTFINDGRVHASRPHILEDGDLIFLGAPSRAATARFHATDLAPMTAEGVEADLLLALAEGVTGADAVYADWLEGRGHVDRAELVRTCDALDREPLHTQGFWELWRRRDVLSDRIDIGWRLRLLAARG